MQCIVARPDGEIGAHGVLGYNLYLEIDFSQVTKTTELPKEPWADDVKYVTFEPVVYNPDGQIDLDIFINNNDRITSVFIECSQDEFIALARYLNTIKNRLLKMRKHKEV